MIKLIIIISAMLFLTKTVGATPQEVRDSCVEQTVNRCLVQCEKTNTIDCSQACQENAQNQCRQAGE